MAKRGSSNLPVRTGPTAFSFDTKRRPAPPLGGYPSGITGAAENVMMSGVAVSITASRTSGVAPLGVFFEADVSGSMGVTYPFHELLYVWDFDETGTWGYGNTLQTSKGAATGPVAAHVFSESGAGGTSHDVTCTVYRRSGGVTSQIAQDTVTISTTSSVTEFNVAGKLVCWSVDSETGSGLSNATYRQTSSGSNVVAFTQAQIATDITNGVRAWLFKSGETFTTPNGDEIVLPGGNDDPKLFASWGAGASPIIVGNTTNGTIECYGGGSDVRFKNIHMRNQSAADTPANGACAFLSSAVSNVLFLDCSFGTALYGLEGAHQLQEVNSPGELSNHIFVHGCSFGVDAGVASTRDAPLYFGAYKVSVQGNDIDNSNGGLATAGPHTYRAYAGNYLLCQHNRFEGSINGAGQEIKITPPPFDGTSGAWTDGKIYNNSIISDNYFELKGNAWPLGLGPQNGTADNEYTEDFIVERNFFNREVNATQNNNTCAFLWGVRMTFRNNICRVAGTTTHNDMRMAVCETRDSGPSPTAGYAWIYNNSLYTATAPTTYGWGVSANTSSGTSKMYNNIAFSTSGSWSAISNGASADTGNNDVVTSTPFASATPTTTETDFRVAGGAAEDAGAEVVGLFRDYEGTSVTTGSINQGAFQDQT